MSTTITGDLTLKLDPATGTGGHIHFDNTIPTPREITAGKSMKVQSQEQLVLNVTPTLVDPSHEALIRVGAESQNGGVLVKSGSKGITIDSGQYPLSSGVNVTTNRFMASGHDGAPTEFIIKGNLSVIGQKEYVDTNNVYMKDSIFVLNALPEIVHQDSALVFNRYPTAAADLATESAFCVNTTLAVQYSALLSGQTIYVNYSARNLTGWTVLLDDNATTARRITYASTATHIPNTQMCVLDRGIPLTLSVGTTVRLCERSSTALKWNETDNTFELIYIHSIPELHGIGPKVDLASLRAHFLQAKVVHMNQGIHTLQIEIRDNAITRGMGTSIPFSANGLPAFGSLLLFINAKPPVPAAQSVASAIIIITKSRVDYDGIAVHLGGAPREDHYALQVDWLANVDPIVYYASSSILPTPPAPASSVSRPYAITILYSA